MDTSNIMTELATQFGTNALHVIYAIIAIIVGLIVAKIIGIALKHAFEKLGIERKIKEKKLHNALLGFTITGIITFLLELAVFLVFLGIAASILSIDFVTWIVVGAVEWLGRAAVAVVILTAGLFIGEILSNRIESSKIAFSNWWSIAIEVLIVFITVIMALDALGPLFENTVQLLTYAFTIAIAAIFIALGLGMGLAIGLGGQDTIKKVLNKKQADIEKLF